MKLKPLFDSLQDGDSIAFTYQFEEYGEMKERDLIVEAHTNYKGDELLLSIKTKIGFLGSMNIDKVTPSRLKAYDFNMMSVRSTYDFIFKNILEQSIVVSRKGLYPSIIDRNRLVLPLPNFLVLHSSTINGE